MNKKIKELIKEIRRGDVPKGYRQTSVGVIPYTWGVDKLEKHLVEYEELSNDTNNIPVATSSREGLILQSDYYQQRRFDETRNGFRVVPRGYITYRHMSDDDIFRFNVNDIADKVLVSPEYPVFTTKKSLNQTLLINYLNTSPYFLSFCHKQKKGSTRTRMYYKNLKQFTMPIPTAIEQEKISEILICLNNVIELKKALIIEKNNQKKWLMRNLLDPDRGIRLPGFVGNWKQFRLSILGNTYPGLSGKTAEDFGKGKPYIPYLNIYENQIVDCSKFEFVSVSEGENQNLVKYGDILFTTSSETANEVGMSSVYLGINHEIYLNSFCFGYRLHNFDNLVPEFAAYYFRCQKVKKLMYKLAQGATRYNLSKTELMKEAITIPPTKEEQIAIANVFFVIDSEIKLLEQELDEWQKKKKTLMQLLLAGLVRVNV